MVERGQRLLQRYVVRPGVQLPQVDVVDVQPSQRSLEVAQQGTARGVGDPLAPADAEPGLGRDHQVVAVHHVAEQGPDQSLAVAVAVRRGRVDQRAAGGHERGELLARLVLVGVPPPGHGAQAEPAHRQSTVTEIALLHEPSLLRPTDNGSLGSPVMRLGLNIGFVFGGDDHLDHLRLVKEAERLGFSVTWAAEAYGSDAATAAQLDRRPDHHDRRRRGGVPDPGPDPGDDRDDRRHPGPAVRTAGSGSASACPGRRCRRAGTASGSLSRCSGRVSTLPS